LYLRALTSRQGRLRRRIERPHVLVVFVSFVAKQELRSSPLLRFSCENRYLRQTQLSLGSGDGQVSDDTATQDLGSNALPNSLAHEQIEELLRRRKRLAVE
jgi:hypothetical protein